MAIGKQKNDEKNTATPPLYNGVVPLFSKTHKGLKLERKEDYSYAKDAVAIVLAVDEFSLAERDYPILFSDGEWVMPVALMGVPGGENQFVTEDGKWRSGAYIPAYIRRYPFILAKLKPDSESLTLCFDPNCAFLVDADEGDLFNGDEPSERAKAIMRFCEEYEGAILRTQRFVRQLQDLDLLMDAQADIRFAGQEPVNFRGFRIISEEKFRKLDKEKVHQLADAGALPLIHAHFFSLKNIERRFAWHFERAARGKGRKEKAA